MTPKSLKVVQLREELTARGLSPKGLKQELVDRLEQAIAAEKSPKSKKTDEVEIETPSKTPSKRSSTRSGRNFVAKKEESMIEKHESMEETGATMEAKDENMAEKDENMAEKDENMELKEKVEVKNSKKAKAFEEKQEKNDESLSSPPRIVSRKRSPSPSAKSLETASDESMKCETLTEKRTKIADESKTEKKATSPQKDEKIKKVITTMTTTMTTTSPSNKPNSSSLSASPVEITNFLHIKNFVRPLIVSKVKDMLSNYGEISFFWMDSFKTQCFVKFESLESATKCHDNIFGIVWPSETGKALYVEYVSDTVAEERMKAVGHSNNTSQEASPKELVQKTFAAADKDDEHVSGTAATLILDDLFRKTATLPPLYWMEASASASASEK